MVCDDCRSETEVVQFGCSHKFCSDCIVLSVFLKLQVFYLELRENLAVYEGRASYLGCKYECEDARLSLSLREVLVLVDRSRVLSLEQIAVFKEYSLLGIHFFSGIKSFFSVCSYCNKLQSDISKKLLICKECIKKACISQTNRSPSMIIFENQSDEDLFRAKAAGFKSFSLIELAGDSPEYQVLSGSIRFSKLRVLTKKTRVCVFQENISGEAEEDLYIPAENYQENKSFSVILTLIP